MEVIYLRKNRHRCCLFECSDWNELVGQKLSTFIYPTFSWWPESVHCGQNLSTGGQNRPPRWTKTVHHCNLIGLNNWMWTSIECHLDTNLRIKIDFKSSQMDRTDYNFRYIYTSTANNSSKSYRMSKNKRLCSRVHYSA